MTPFEYVIVLISIILGLGITTILTGVAELIKHTRPVGLYTPYIIWILLIFILHFQDWWLSYQLMVVKEWSLQFFLLIVLYPINLYILAHLLFPAALSKEFNSREFFINHYPRLFIGAVTLVLLSVIQNIFVSGQSGWTQVPHVIVVAVLGTMIGIKSKSNLAHTTVSLLLLILMVAGFIYDQENLIIR